MPRNRNLLANSAAGVDLSSCRGRRLVIEVGPGRIAISRRNGWPQPRLRFDRGDSSTTKQRQRHGCHRLARAHSVECR